MKNESFQQGEEKKIYFYIIKGNGLEYKLLTEDRYEIGDLYRLYQEDSMLTQTEIDEGVCCNNRKNLCPFPKEIYGSIVDRKLIHEGDIIDFANIVEINEDEVEFEQDGNRWTNKVGNDSISLR